MTLTINARVTAAETLRCLANRLMREDWPEGEAEWCQHYPLCDRLRIVLAGAASEKRTKENV